MILGAAMLVADLIRVYIGTHMHARTRIIVGFSIVLGWPTNSVVILGALPGVDLVFTGVMWIGLGIRPRSHV